MVKLTLVCLPVALEGQEDAARDKVVNRRFAQLKSKLESAGVQVCKLDVPDVVASLATIDDVLEEIKDFEETASHLAKHLETLVPPFHDPHDDLKWALFSIEQFSWDGALPTKTSTHLSAAVRHIKAKVGEIKREFEEKLGVCDRLTASVKAMERRTGSVLDGELAFMVDPKDMHPGEFLGTLLVAVPLALEEEWLRSYASMFSSVAAVPNSSSKICQDGNHALYKVMVVRSFAKDFGNEARKRGFIVRPFEMKKEEHEVLFQKKIALLKEEADSKEDLEFWSSTDAQNQVSKWRLHLLALRASADSTSRYGLKSPYMSFVVATKDPVADREMRRQFQEIAGSKNILTDEEWRVLGSIGLSDGSENFNYLSVPFDL